MSKVIAKCKHCKEFDYKEELDDSVFFICSNCKGLICRGDYKTPEEWDRYGDFLTGLVFLVVSVLVLLFWRLSWKL